MSEAGGWFSIKVSSYQYRKSHCGDKTILWPSYLHNGISYTGKMTSLYWIRAQSACWLQPWWGVQCESGSSPRLLPEPPTVHHGSDSPLPRGFTLRLSSVWECIYSNKHRSIYLNSYMEEKYNHCIFWLLSVIYYDLLWWPIHFK